MHYVLSQSSAYIPVTSSWQCMHYCGFEIDATNLFQLSAYTFQFIIWFLAHEFEAFKYGMSKIGDIFSDIDDSYIVASDKNIK